MSKAGLWNGELEWFLRCADSALGARGTTASVVSMIERGGATSSGDFDTLALQRIGWAMERGKGGHANVARARRLAARWHALPSAHQRIAVAHYLAGPRAPSKVAARFGELAGVVVHFWMFRSALGRVSNRADLAETISQQRQPLAAELEALESEVRIARSRMVNPRTAADRQRAFRARARLWHLERAARPLRSAVGDLCAREAAVATLGGPEHDLADLVRACERGEPAGLRERAEEAVVALHAAWGRTGKDPATTKRGQREERVQEFLEEMGL